MNNDVYSKWIPLSLLREIEHIPGLPASEGDKEEILEARIRSHSSKVQSYARMLFKDMMESAGEGPAGHVQKLYPCSEVVDYPLDNSELREAINDTVLSLKDTKGPFVASTLDDDVRDMLKDHLKALLAIQHLRAGAVTILEEIPDE